MSGSATTRVLAALIARDGRWLLGLRPYDKRHAGCWEFPGGKVEPGESDAEAMARELREELDLTLVSLGAERFVQRDGDSPFEITFVEVDVAGTPRALEHVALAWVSAEEFAHHPLAPSDLACARVLANGVSVEPPPVRNPAQHEAYLQNCVRDAEQFNAGLVDTASYASYIEYACRVESVRVPVMQMLRAQSIVTNDDPTRDALLALVTRIAALPPVPEPERPPPPPRPAWVMLSHLRPGERVVVRTAFRTFDGDEIEAGRTLTFLGYTFFPHDDGYTFSFREGGFRLSGLVAENEAVMLNDGERYFVMAP